ncbi:zinc ribbon domain-containing protein [Opitutus sp. ER46]|uniref:FmdB family zinc ribbon protein n=1 Tax=Opitutus sp. ER46 TaxID=2161864 RepID=UPI000D314623|nr:zinc ribbon domain-containing protein [Opitutus sp. ER46]PTX90771.1 FmdB family transcriptional regulator [Opitutus sp. ER46]
MPTYDYACPKCGHTFEAFQSMKDAPLKTCPKCKKTGVKRLLGAGAGLIFKGSGFYITDYKKSSGSVTSTNGSAKSSESKSTASGGGAKSSAAPKSS